MKKVLIFSFLLFTCSFLISSCHCKKKATSDAKATTEVPRDFAKEGYVQATVIYYEMDACKYLLLVNGEKKLEPSTSLAPDFQKDQLAVWIKYAPKKGGVSACMAGQVVDISDIQIRK
jgi:hypothetical protein